MNGGNVRGNELFELSLAKITNSNASSLAGRGKRFHGSPGRSNGDVIRDDLPVVIGRLESKGDLLNPR